MIAGFFCFCFFLFSFFFVIFFVCLGEKFGQIQFISLFEPKSFYKAGGGGELGVGIFLKKNFSKIFFKLFFLTFGKGGLENLVGFFKWGTLEGGNLLPWGDWFHNLICDFLLWGRGGAFKFVADCFWWGLGENFL